MQLFMWTPGAERRSSHSQGQCFDDSSVSLPFSFLLVLFGSLLSSLSFLSFSDSISYGGIRYLAPSFLEMRTRDPDKANHSLKVTKLLGSKARTESGHDYFST